MITFDVTGRYSSDAGETHASRSLRCCVVAFALRLIKTSQRALECNNIYYVQQGYLLYIVTTF